MNQQEGKPRKIKLTAFSHVAEKITVPMPAVTAGTVIVGETNRKIFWSAFLGGLLVTGIMLALVSNNVLAMAASLPVPFTVRNTTIRSGNFRLYPGLSGSTPKTGVVIVQMDATITGQVITKTVSLPGVGNVTVKVSAGTHPGRPVVIKGLLLDANSINATQAQFQNLTVSASGLGGFEQSGTSQVLTNAVISSPYLFANSISLPDLSITVTAG